FDIVLLCFREGDLSLKKGTEF
ncbi:hypothetical protein A5797_001331, partial [Enterococcus faecalis]